MNFFESYADAVMHELNEDRSNLGDIVVDWNSLIQKETTATTYDTYEAVTPNTKHNFRPTQDGIMPDSSKSAYKPRDAERPNPKLRDIWTSNNSTLKHSIPITLTAYPNNGPVVIVRKKNTQFTTKRLRKK